MDTMNNFLYKELSHEVIGCAYIDYWLVEKSILVGILAGKGDVRVYDIFRMRSYLKKLNLHHGIIAYWSNKNLQILGIYEA